MAVQRVAHKTTAAPLLRSTVQLGGATGAVLGWLIGCATVFLTVPYCLQSILAILGWSILYYTVISVVISMATALLFLLVNERFSALRGYAAWTASAITIMLILVPFALGTLGTRGLVRSSFAKILLALSIIGIVIVAIGVVKRWWFPRRTRWYLRPSNILIACFLIMPLISTVLLGMFAQFSGVSDTTPQLSEVSEKPTPVMIIGFDAAGWDVLYPMQKMGKVPVFTHLINHGSSAYLNTLDEGKSLLIWTTVATGRFPHKHGIRDWLYHSLPGCPEPIYHGPPHTGFDRLFPLLARFSLSSSSVPDARHRRSPALWNIAEVAGLTSCVINWWATWPVEMIDGVMISNYFFPIEESSLRQVQDSGRDNTECSIHPDTMEQTYRDLWEKQQEWAHDNFDRIFGFSMQDMRLSMSNPIPLTSSWVLAIDAATAAAMDEMIGNEACDLLMVYFRGLDLIEHFFWKYLYPEFFERSPVVEQKLFGSIIPEWYSLYDRFLANSLDRVSDERNIIILSDHAMLPEMKPNKYNKSGQHASGPAGIIIANGPAFDAGKGFCEAGVEDVYPTVLRLLGLPQDSTADGSILTEGLRSLPSTRLDKVKAIDYRYVMEKRNFCTLSQEKMRDKDIRLMLRQLGYIE